MQQSVPLRGRPKQEPIPGAARRLSRYVAARTGMWNEEAGTSMAEPSLYERLGGVFAIGAVIDHFSDAVVQNPIVGQAVLRAVLRGIRQRLASEQRRGRVARARAGRRRASPSRRPLIRTVQGTFANARAPQGSPSTRAEQKHRACGDAQQSKTGRRNLSRDRSAT
jgi:hypothetical protein